MLEFCESDLSKYLVGRDRRLSEPEVAALMQQVAWAVEHLHGDGIIHRWVVYLLLLLQGW